MYHTNFVIQYEIMDLKLETTVDTSQYNIQYEEPILPYYLIYYAALVTKSDTPFTRCGFLKGIFIFNAITYISIITLLERHESVMAVNS